VDVTLHEQHPDLSAPERRRKLAKALWMPMFSMGFDDALQKGGLPEGPGELDAALTEQAQG
jgi:hypothetical protein